MTFLSQATSAQAKALNTHPVVFCKIKGAQKGALYHSEECCIIQFLIPFLPFPVLPR